MERTRSCTDDRLTFLAGHARLCATLGLSMFAGLTACTYTAAETARYGVPAARIPDSVSTVETVNLGYTTQSRSTITGAVSSLALPTNARRAQVRSLAELLQGRIAGLAVQATGGGSVSMRIDGARGQFGVTPLVVIDGTPLSAGAGLESLLSAIDPNDVVRVDVLKDASATAIYGTRGSAGVVLITMRHKAQ